MRLKTRIVPVGDAMRASALPTGARLSDHRQLGGERRAAAASIKHIDLQDSLLDRHCRSFSGPGPLGTPRRSGRCNSLLPHPDLALKVLQQLPTIDHGPPTLMLRNAEPRHRTG